MAFQRYGIGILGMRTMNLSLPTTVCSVCLHPELARLLTEVFLLQSYYYQNGRIFWGKWWKSYCFKPPQMSTWIFLKWEENYQAFCHLKGGQVVCRDPQNVESTTFSKYFFKWKYLNSLSCIHWKGEPILMNSSPTCDDEEPHIPQKESLTCYLVFWMYLCDKMVCHC